MPGSISRGGPGLSRIGSRSPRSRKLTRGFLGSRGSLPVTARNEYRREPNQGDNDEYREDGPVDERDLDALIRANQHLAVQLHADSSESEYNNTKYKMLQTKRGIFKAEGEENTKYGK